MRAALRRGCAISLAAIGLSSVLVTQQAQAASFTTVTTAYGPDAVNQALTVYEPATPGPHPAILYVHGGCWERGTLVASEINLAKEIAQSTGWVVATMTYRMTSANWSTMPQDVDSALRKLQTGGFGVDPARVAMWGESAGGQLSLVEGMKGTGRPGLGRPAGVVSMAGPVDMRTEVASGGQKSVECVEEFEGGPPDGQAMVDRYSATSAVNWVDKTDPPVFLGNGVGDTLVPVSQPAELAADLEAEGVPATVTLTATDHHADAAEYDAVVGGTDTLMQTAINWLAQTV